MNDEAAKLLQDLDNALGLNQGITLVALLEKNQQLQEAVDQLIVAQVDLLTEPILKQVLQKYEEEKQGAVKLQDQPKPGSSQPVQSIAVGFFSSVLIL